MTIELDDKEIELIISYLRCENSLVDTTHTPGFYRANAVVRKNAAEKLVQKLIKIRGK